MATPIPAPLTSFLGRAAELEALQAALGRGERLIALVGAGGIGKTRVAVELARRHAGEVRFCDLTEARHADDVTAALARAVDVPLAGAAGDEALARIGAAAGDLGAALLVVDNCEQVVDAAAAGVRALLELAPRLHVLVTSRQRLRLADELVVDLAPLAGDAALGLLVDRARRVAAGWAGDDAELAAAGRIAAHLEGLPLAIELAAARAATLGAAELLGRLERRFEVLAGGSRDVAPRQQTLRATVDWSWQLLEPAEQTALAQLAVFRGGFTVAAAEAVVALTAHPERSEAEPGVLDLVHTLREKSLLHTREGRLTMFAAIRDLALERLAGSGAAEEALRRHAAWCAQQGRALAAEADRARSGDAFARLAAEQDNLAAVVDRALERAADRGWIADAIAALLAVEPLRVAAGPLQPHADALARVMAAPGFAGVAIGLRAAAHRSRGRVRELLGDRGGAGADYRDALALASEAGDAAAQNRLLLRLGALASAAGRFDEAADHVEVAFLLADRLDDRPLVARALTHLGVIASDRGDLADARARFERAAAIYGDLGDRRRVAIVAGNLAEALHELGEPDAARTAADGAVAELTALGDRRSAALFAVARATFDHERGDLAAARAGYGGALQALEAVGDRVLVGAVLGYLAAIDAATGDPVTAEQRLAAAAELLEAAGDAPGLAALPVHRGHIDLAAGRRAAAEALLAAPAPPPQKVRAAQRLLAAALRGGAAIAPSPDTLVVGADGRWFRAGTAAPVDLVRRPTLGRVLLVLVGHQQRGAERSLSAADLFAAAWPGERIQRAAAANRVRVAVATLRDLGLRAHLLTDADGYHLAARLAIRHDPAARAPQLIDD